ncbi:MAG: transporter [Polaribacter sp.]
MGFFLLGFTSIYGQYTEVINSNKPGFSESPYSVGTGVYQFESNFFYRNTNIKSTFSRPQSFGADVLFRTSFFLEKLEINAQIAFQQDKIAFKNVFTSQYNTTGFSKMVFGAKYLVFQQKYTDKKKEIRSWKRRRAFDKKRLIPSVAIYLGINTDFVNDVYKTGGITPKAGILLQNNLTRDFNLITNLYYDKIGSDFSEFSFIVTATQNYDDYWSFFVENQTIFQKYQTSTNIGGGLAYLFNRNLQINASGRFLMENRTNGFYASLGLSYRIDRHKDAFTELDDTGKKLKETSISKYNKRQNGFFNRLFKIFKKKDSKRSRPKRSRKPKKS